MGADRMTLAAVRKPLDDAFGIRPSRSLTQCRLDPLDAIAPGPWLDVLSTSYSTRQPASQVGDDRGSTALPSEVAQALSKSSFSASKSRASTDLASRTINDLAQATLDAIGLAFLRHESTSRPLARPQAFRFADGTVQFEWHAHGDHLELSIDADGIIVLLVDSEALDVSLDFELHIGRSPIPKKAIDVLSRITESIRRAKQISD